MDLNISLCEISGSKGNLYKLPKDILVKLILTIENETKNKCEENHAKEIHRMLNSVPNNQNAEFGICDYENCEYFYLSDGYEFKAIYKYKDISFNTCIRCYRSFCENHKTELSNFDETRYICNKCCTSSVI